MTGIVGPNGCGKSNLVEALRWVMGENSAKRMRGGEMDDVIFGGTDKRPARNLAEVALTLQDVGPRAVPLIPDEPEVEVARRIERGSGSDYRVAGRDVRARDVQLLFADSATGAHSTALVSQGRIGAIINAKPIERRSLLEEAAGIGGLHSRRHEAELRLKAAEANLARLDDVLVTMRAQFDTLKKQARQAGRYRRLSEHIRRAEAILLHLQWREAERAVAVADTRLREAEREVAGLTERSVAAARLRETAYDALPPMRQEEATASAELQRLVIAGEQLDEEERRVQQARGEAEKRLVQLRQDLQREAALAADATAALERLAGERGGIDEAQAAESGAQQAAAARLREAEVAVAAVETELATLTEEVAGIEARRAGLARSRSEAEEKRARLAQRLAETTLQRDRLAAEAVPPEQVARAEAAVAEAEEAVERTRLAADAAEAALRAAQETETGARQALHEVDGRRAKLANEAQALTELLAASTAKATAPIVDALKVEPGYEAALGAALGDDLAAPADTAAARHWATLAPYETTPALPAGAEPLALRVETPPALSRRLAQIGVVADAGEAERLRPLLLPGQRLVTREGALWRWDGFTVAAGAPSQSAQRLKQRNRLAELKRALTALEEELTSSREAHEAGRVATTRAGEAERNARQAMRDAVGAVGQARSAHAALAQKAATTESRLAGLIESAERFAAEIADTERQRDEAAGALGQLPDPALGREQVARKRAVLAEARGVQLAAQSERDRLAREALARVQRLAAIALEERSWRTRADDAARQRATLEERGQALAEEIETLAAKPLEITQRRASLGDLIEAARGRKAKAGDALAEGEANFADAEKLLKTAEAALAAAREERVRCEATAGQAGETKEALLRRVAERLDCAPAQILENAQIPPDEAFPALAECEQRLERLLREREGMGPVNLMAEDEANELETRIAGLDHEREDLTAAIARLRQGIAALNREGRERLLAAFTTVNGHFESLFVRLFGGGHAHLKLDETEGDDPLAAGLEIMASPPGKRLQSLSLLSGGEQALTALALLFAVFLTNPAPICVLDEVDAPLDDANVDRFCRLVEEIAATAETRFLIITHHRTTMARMDRLYGVTMAERGVSQLVSVDLQQAVRLRKIA
jgi:chromosome segregation protein